MLRRIVKFGSLLLAYLLLGAHRIQAQQSPNLCDNPPIYREYSTNSRAPSWVEPTIHFLGNLLLVGWWLLAAGLVVVLVRLFRRSLAAWVLMWLPLPMVLWVALPPLQVLHQRLEELQRFLEQCGEYIGPDRNFDYYKQRQWEHASPYILMLAATASLYVGASIYLVKFRRSRPAS